MNLERVRQILTDIQFQDWEFIAEPFGHEGAVVLYARFPRPDAHTGEPGWGVSRSELIAANATLDSVVKTCWLLVELTTRHECMEFFTFAGQRIFDPHTPVVNLVLMQVHRGDQQQLATALADTADVLASETGAPMPILPPPSVKKGPILHGDVPLSLQAAKGVLYPHADPYMALVLAIDELPALCTTKAIKKEAERYLTRAARELSEEKARRKGG